jgi:hypothetical protein
VIGMALPSGEVAAMLKATLTWLAFPPAADPTSMTTRSIETSVDSYAVAVPTPNHANRPGAMTTVVGPGSGISYMKPLVSTVFSCVLGPCPAEPHAVSDGYPDSSHGPGPPFVRTI